MGSQIGFGGLREKVKSGKVGPQEVLKFLKGKKDVPSSLLNWLENFDIEVHQKRSEEQKKILKEKKK